MATPRKDHYAILRVSANATAAEVKAAFRKLAFETHPDHNGASDANRRMAELIEARDVLLDADQRARFDRERGGGPRKPPTAWGEQRREEARKPATRVTFREPPASGQGSIQPWRLPDWYAFLGIRAAANSSEVLVALRRMGAQVNAAPYAPAVASTLRQQVREAGSILTDAQLRDIYDRALLEGKAPKPGTHPRLHRDYYSYLGVRRGSGRLDDEIAEAATELSGRLSPKSPEYEAFLEAWRALRDPVARAAYDAQLAEEPASV